MKTFLGDFRSILAIAASIGLHLMMLNAFAEPRNHVLIQGGSVQVELGLSAASSPAVANGGDPSPQKPKTAPDQLVEEDVPPPPEPQPIEQAETVPEKTSRPLEQVASALPVEDRPEPQPQETSEAKEPPAADPKPEPKKAATEQTDPANEEQEVTEDKVTEASPPPMPEGGAPSLPSAGTSADGAGAPQSAAQPGNAESMNYAGQVMRHLSRVRRPRAAVAGSAYVNFSISPSGDLENVRIATTSGSKKFDRDALGVVKRAAPFPRPPAGINREFVVEIEGE